MSIKEQYSVQSIKPSETYDWLLNKHYANRIPSISYAFGLFEGKILIGVCTFGSPASNSLCIGVCGINYKSQIIELNRLCVNDHNTKNLTSYFLGNCLKMLPAPKIVVSYSDTQQNHNGYIYQATNWIYTGATKERTDIGFEDNKHSRHYNKNIDYTQNRKFRSSKHRYIMFLGNKTQKKNMLKNLKYNIEPYPKGQNKRYDASYQPQVQLNLL
tara:strand:+ start:44 stop:685 length:642 start_codon:yes stop_codon:yes gene_type:complete